MRKVKQYIWKLNVPSLTTVLLFDESTLVFEKKKTYKNDLTRVDNEYHSQAKKYFKTFFSSILVMSSI